MQSSVEAGNSRKPGDLQGYWAHESITVISVTRTPTGIIRQGGRGERQAPALHRRWYLGWVPRSSGNLASAWEA